MKKYKSFDVFTKALVSLEKEDKKLYSWDRNRLALCHALATHLKDEYSKFDSSLSVDLCPNLSRSKKTINPDILVHNRDDKNKILAIVCRNDYLTEEEQKELLNLCSNIKCDLVMAVSFFPQKNYMLLYRALKDRVEYYHFDRNTLTSNAVRTKETGTRKLKDSTQQLF